ncbi:MAG: hypothetical protein KGN84_19250 [Acidobacteriota bacterium]|nr:hypothetical protein [Acidobacteriota bacterium]
MAPPQVKYFAAWVSAFFFCVPIHGQISPGPLSRAHAQLEGVTHCTACHDFGSGEKRFRCLECHAEIARRLNTNAGFHGREVHRSNGEEDCARCHMEHNGRGFALVRFDKSGFDHKARTGFLLEGKHRTLKCEACHRASNISASAATEIRVKDKEHTFLGLHRECSSCHRDAHSGEAGANCTSCHSQDAWTPASGFDHSKTHFPLTGLHTAVPCVKCHSQWTTGADPSLARVSFKGMRFNACQDCHRDPHRGAFQDAKVHGGCDTCHNTAGWKTNRAAQAFSHANTSFPLEGKHADVACSRCHKTENFHNPVPHKLCSNCHEDAHTGQFANRPQGSDCSNCHDVSGFRPSKFTSFTHATAAFALNGKHSNAECAACHAPAGKATVWETRRLLCSACHSDAHSAQFAGAPWMNRCSLCHSDAGFEQTSFERARHGATRFPLTGAHTRAACEACHAPVESASAAGVSIVANVSALRNVSTAGFPVSREFHFKSTSCSGCHSDPHAMNASAALPCETCHSPERWTDTRPFDHSKTPFPPEGAHREAACRECHRRETDVRSVAAEVVPRFSGTPAVCGACHEGPHGGQFRADPAEDCSVCHVPGRWKDLRLDHDRTRYPLDRAHTNVACAKCHKPASANAGGGRLYRGTPRECVTCH